MPLPSEHAARQVSPGAFREFRRSKPSGFPDGVSAIFGIRPDGKSEIQSLRFDRKLWTASRARGWLKDHGFKTSEFEAASNTTKRANVDPEVTMSQAIDPSALEGTLELSGSASEALARAAFILKSLPAELVLFAVEAGSLEMPPVAKRAIAKAPKTVRRLRDEINRIVIDEAAPFEAGEPNYFGNPTSKCGEPTSSILVDLRRMWPREAPLPAYYRDDFYPGRYETMMRKVADLRHALHKLAPELEGSELGSSVSAMLGELDQLDGLVPEGVSKRIADNPRSAAYAAVSGLHAHALTREDARTKSDGAHAHVFELPDGSLVTCEEGGEHMHTMQDQDAAESDHSGRHSHVVVWNGQRYTSSSADETDHHHNLMIEESTFDGTHMHYLEIPGIGGGYTLSLGEVWERIDSPEQSPNPPARPAKSVAKCVSLSVWKDADGVTNGAGVPGEMPLAGENVMTSSDLSQGGRLQPAQGTGRKPKKPTRKFDASEFEASRLAGLSDKDLLELDENAHAIFAGFGHGVAKSEGVDRSVVVDAHRSMMNELAKRGIGHGWDDALTVETTTVAKIVMVAKTAALRKRTVQDAEERFILGVVLEPNDGDDGVPLDPDSQKDIYSDDDIRKTAHEFLSDFRNIGLMHEELINRDVRILESYLAPVDFEMETRDGKIEKVRKGSWLLALRILSDELWAQVKTGELAAYSIGGDARRTKVAPPPN